MRPIRSLLIYLLVVFVGGALLAPWLYWLAHWVGGNGSAVSGLAKNPFHRFVDRSLLGLALIFLWPLLRASGLRKWSDVGFVTQGNFGLEMLKGFGLGFVSLACVALVAFTFGANKFVGGHTSVDVIRHLLNATWAAVVVAILEELIFRGALFGTLRKSLSWPAALVLSSAGYSAVHFIRTSDPAAVIQWYSGLTTLGRLATQHPPLIPEFFTLFAVGCVLALCYQRTGALYFSIGLHAGWIFWKKSYGFLFQQTGVSSFWGTSGLTDGWLSFLVVTAVFVIIVRRRALARNKPS